mgnify:CR=1 FL=1
MCIRDSHILEYIKPRISELDVAMELDYFIRSNGDGEVSFDTIVASGRNSAIPHSEPSVKRIEEGDVVVLDFGAVSGGYHSDMTRTVGMGKIDEKLKTIYDLAYRALQNAINSLKPGLKGKDVDRLVRSIIEKEGYGKYFFHNTGHGIGLDVHESPKLSSLEGDKLQENMVITIEPGIYLPEYGGVRIENMILIKKTGCEVLTKSPEKLILL